MTAVALCASMALDAVSDAPEWLHLLPAGEARTFDGRGPFRVKDASAVIRKSMTGGKLVLDENHSTDLAAPQGHSSPARGWIVDLQARADGIWGKVQWTPEGRGLAAAYRGISPAIMHNANGDVIAILRASLTNVPNIVGLTSLHSRETNMDLRSQLTKSLNMDARSSDATIVRVVEEMRKALGSKISLNAQQTEKPRPMAEALDLAREAARYQTQCAQDGLAIDWPTAVRYVHEKHAAQKDL